MSLRRTQRQRPTMSSSQHSSRPSSINGFEPFGGLVTQRMELSSRQSVSRGSSASQTRTAHSPQSKSLGKAGSGRHQLSRPPGRLGGAPQAPRAATALETYREEGARKFIHSPRNVQVLAADLARHADDRGQIDQSTLAEVLNEYGLDASAQQEVLRAAVRNGQHDTDRVQIQVDDQAVDWEGIVSHVLQTNGQSTADQDPDDPPRDSPPPSPQPHIYGYAGIDETLYSDSPQKRGIGNDAGNDDDRLPGMVMQGQTPSAWSGLETLQINTAQDLRDGLTFAYRTNPNLFRKMFQAQDMDYDMELTVEEMQRFICTLFPQVSSHIVNSVLDLFPFTNTFPHGTAQVYREKLQLPFSILMKFVSGEAKWMVTSDTGALAARRTSFKPQQDTTNLLGWSKTSAGQDIATPTASKGRQSGSSSKKSLLSMGNNTFSQTLADALVSPPPSRGKSRGQATPGSSRRANGMTPQMTSRDGTPHVWFRDNDDGIWKDSLDGEHFRKLKEAQGLSKPDASVLADQRAAATAKLLRLDGTAGCLPDGTQRDSSTAIGNGQSTAHDGDLLEALLSNKPGSMLPKSHRLPNAIQAKGAVDAMKRLVKIEGDVILGMCQRCDCHKTGFITRNDLRRIVEQFDGFKFTTVAFDRVCHMVDQRKDGDIAYTKLIDHYREKKALRPTVRQESATIVRRPPSDVPRVKPRTTATPDAYVSDQLVSSVHAAIEPIMSKKWRTVMNACRKADKRRSNNIGPKTFSSTLAKFGVMLSQHDVQRLQQRWKGSRPNTIDYREFCGYFGQRSGSEPGLQTAPVATRTKSLRKTDTMSRTTPISLGTLRTTNPHIQDTLSRIRPQVERSFTELRRTMKSFDLTHEQMPAQQLKAVLDKHDISISQREQDLLLSKLDPDCTGLICYNDFLRTVLK
eukprot:m.289974 g.289974  ORF g.289974 m.289974 type:complete len:911 (+) comp15814_c0_seq1:251-2983(+)